MPLERICVLYDPSCKEKSAEAVRTALDSDSSEIIDVISVVNVERQDDPTFEIAAAMSGVRVDPATYVKSDSTVREIRLKTVTSQLADYGLAPSQDDEQIIIDSETGKSLNVLIEIGDTVEKVVAHGNDNEYGLIIIPCADVEDNKDRDNTARKTRKVFRKPHSQQISRAFDIANNVDASILILK